MDINIINTIIKILGINLFTCYIYFKIINYSRIKPKDLIILSLVSIVTAIIQSNIETVFSKLFRIIALYIFYSIFLSKLTKTKINTSFIISIISIAIVGVVINVCTFIISIIVAFTIPDHYKNPFISIIITLITFVVISVLFKIRRLKNGLAFINNQLDDSYINILVLCINIIVLFSYFLISIFHIISSKHLGIILFIFTIIQFFILQKALILYQKQKLQTQALKDYETQLSETQQKLQTALAEKQTLIKSNHEFHHRQKVLNKKLDDLAKQYSENYNTEFAEELGNISKRLDKLSDEYVEKTHFSPALVKSNIEEIDDMLSYMKSECEKNNIDFSLKIDCDINYIINNFITKSQLETLLGDLISNSIIAISHSSNNYKNIMVIFGIKDSTYELCVLDSGIPFEIDTLLNLGLSPASTHLDEGGTGIGFITTFETINHCNASITISENTNNNYTKSIEIQFDNKNEYRIITNRKDDLIKRNINNRKIIIMD